MQKKIKQEAAAYLARDRRRQVWKRAVTILACVVVFCTVYALILPAITLEKKPQCGKIEHTHTEECYAQPETESKEEHIHTEECYDENNELICGKTKDDSTTSENAAETGELICNLPEHTHSKECMAVQGLKKAAQKNTVEPMSINEASNGDNSREATGQNSEEKKLPVKTITGDGTTYNPETGEFSTDLKITFELAKNEADPNVDYVFKYPKGVLVPAGLIGDKKDFYDGNTKAGTYTFVKNDDGTYSVKVEFDKSYIDSAGDKVKGYVSFSGRLNTKTDDKGDIKITVGEDNLEINIPSDKITYPGDKTDKYDISVQKSGDYKKDGNKLEYTVYIRTKKGTPDPIQFKDQIASISGATLGNPDVKVEKGTYRIYEGYEDYGNVWNTVSVTPTCDNGTISMNLGKLEAGGEEKEEYGNKYKEYNCYKVTYIYELGDQQITDLSVNNKASVESKDEKSGQTVKDEGEKNINVSFNYDHTLTKSGWQSDGKLHWKITINDHHRDITDAILTDTMLGEITNGQNITVSPNQGYQIQYDNNGKITGIKFKKINDAANTESYTIEYSTEPPASGWDNQKVVNDAKFDPTPGKPGDEIDKEGSIDIPGTGSVKKEYNGMKVSSDAKTGVITWKVTIDVPEGGLPAGTVIKDEIGYYGHGMTRNQILAWVDAWKWDGTDQKVMLPNDITFKNQSWEEKTYNQIKEEENDTQKYISFEFKLADALIPPNNHADKIVFTYETTADLYPNDPSPQEFHNKITVGNKSGEDNYKYYKDNVVKTDGNNQTGTTQISSEDGKLTWKVKVSVSEGKGYNELTITDKLPTGVALDEIALSEGTSMKLVIGENGRISGSNNKYMISGQYKRDTGEITLKMNSASDSKPIESNKQYIFTFNCHADSELMGNKFEPDKKYTFKNSVTVKADDIILGNPEQTQEWNYKKPVSEEKIMTKTGNWDNDNRRLSYSIQINPEGKDLVEGADFLTLTDTLTYSSLVHYVVLCQDLVQVKMRFSSS